MMAPTKTRTKTKTKTKITSPASICIDLSTYAPPLNTPAPLVDYWVISYRKYALKTPVTNSGTSLAPLSLSGCPVNGSTSHTHFRSTCQSVNKANNTRISHLESS